MNKSIQETNLMVKNLAEIYESGDMRRVISECQRLKEEFPNSASIFNFFALANKNLGNYKIAIDLYVALLKENPKNSMFLTNLANIYKDQGNWKKAEKNLLLALESNDKTENSYVSLGNLYAQQNRSDECIELYEDLLKNNTIKESKNLSQLYFFLAESYRKKGKSFIDRAIENFTLSSEPLSITNCLEAIYKFKDKDIFLKELKKINFENELNPFLASIQTHASIRYDIPDGNHFCQSPFDFINHSKLTIEEGFDNNLIDKLYQHIKSFDYSTQPLLNNGDQSAGNIFSSNEPYIKKIKDIIMSRINKYKEFYKDSDSGFIKKWPSDFNIQGWIIDIKKGGNLKSHMHKSGWLSGSLYLNVPKEKNSSEGNLVFSLDGEYLPGDGKIFPSKEININTGDIVLFPSSIFHHTLPFDSEENRITFAFDIKPKY